MTTQLHLDDALSTLALLPEESVHLAVFDPPYPTISGGSGPSETHQRPTGILAKNDGKIFDLNAVTPAQYLPELYRVLRPQAHVYMMTNMLGLSSGILATVQEHGFLIHNLLPWVKNNATPSRWYMKDVEYTIFMRKGPAFPIRHAGTKTAQRVSMHPSDLITTWDPDAEFPYALDWPNVKSPKSHPTEKPINLMKTYIENSSEPGHVVLDPFMGTGSTGLAAQELGRAFIGIEMDPTYFKIAAKRLGVQGLTPAQQAMDDLL